MVLLTRQDYKF